MLLRLATCCRACLQDKVLQACLSTPAMRAVLEADTQQTGLQPQVGPGCAAAQLSDPLRGGRWLLLWLMLLQMFMCVSVSIMHVLNVKLLKQDFQIKQQHVWCSKQRSSISLAELRALRLLTRLAAGCWGPRCLLLLPVAALACSWWQQLVRVTATQLLGRWRSCCCCVRPDNA
jgi:hypothetical protein